MCLRAASSSKLLLVTLLSAGHVWCLLSSDETRSDLHASAAVVLQGADKHRSLYEAFAGMRGDGEHPQSVSTMGGARGQRYAAAARTGSLPYPEAGAGQLSWSRSVMAGPDKHRSLFEAFGHLRASDAVADMADGEAACQLRALSKALH